MKHWFVAMALVATTFSGLPWAQAVEVVEVVDDAPAAPTVAAQRSSSDCAAGSERQRIGVSVKPPEGSQLSTVVFDVDYPEKQVAIPGSRNAPSVSERLSGAPGIATVAMNDKDGSVRVVITAGAALPTSKRLFVLEFDVCQGATPPTAADYTCTLGGCVAMNAPVEGCSCNLSLEPAANVPAAKP